MFEPTSRYANVETVTLERVDADGNVRAIAYKRRRFVPPAAGQTTLVQHRFAAGERLDTITARYFGEPTQFWQICDANDVLRPSELEAEVGRPITIAMPSL
jgi:hypothetical protein